jgi:hypothetical protein
MRVAIVALAFLALAPAASGQTGDSVTGNARIDSPVQPGSPPFTVSFSFDAHSGPSGENPTGTAAAAIATPFGNFGAGGTVTCLNVSGTQATLGTSASSTETTFFFLSGGGSTIGFGTVPNAIAQGRCPLSAFFFGSAYSQFFEPRAVSFNDVTIVDAPPLPTSTDQCKKDGWRAYGFRNQGACVSFVNAASRPAR